MYLFSLRDSAEKEVTLTLNTKTIGEFTVKIKMNPPTKENEGEELGNVRAKT